VIAGGAWGWSSATVQVSTDLGQGYANTTVTIPGGFWLASFGAFAFGIAIVVNPRRAALFGMLYGVLEGFVLGAISAMFDAQTEGIVGAAILSTVVVFALRPVVAAALRRLARLPDLGRWVDASEIPWRAAVATAIAGCLGHVVPDAIMHADVEPFAPFTSDNPFLDLVPLEALHVGLLVLGALGAGALLARHRRPRA